MGLPTRWPAEQGRRARGAKRLLAACAALAVGLAVASSNACCPGFIGPDGDAAALLGAAAVSTLASIVTAIAAIPMLAIGWHQDAHVTVSVGPTSVFLGGDF